MTNSIKISNKEFKISDTFLFVASRATNNPDDNLSDLTIYTKTQVPTTLKTGTQEELNQELKNYKEVLNQNGLYNFALVADRFLINMENANIFARNYYGEYFVDADFSFGPTIQLFSTKDKDDFETMLDEYKSQENIYIQKNCLPLVLDKSPEEDVDKLPED